VSGLLASLDGRSVLRSERRGPDDEGPGLGAALAEELLASGGEALLNEGGLAVP
jgi:hypothetical protein